MAASKIYQHPIGIFDSGLGGLTVAKAVLKLLPGEDIVYFGDTARVPYGTKSKDSIIRFSLQNAEVLRQHQVKAIVVACNSSSSYALPALRRQLDIPVLGVIGAGVRKALQVTRTGRVGVIATPATVNSGSYQRQLLKKNSTCKVVAQACPLFVPLVEEGWFDCGVTISVAREYLRPIQKAKVDTLILGCTHYPLLKQALRKILGPDVFLVDSAQEAALELQSLLEAQGLLNTAKHKAKNLFLVSDGPEHFRRLAGKFLGREIVLKKKSF